MRKIATCSAALSLLAAAAPAPAAAAGEQIPTPTIKVFRGRAVPIPGPHGRPIPGTGNFYSAGADVEGEFELEGTGYGANPKNPAGGIAPLSGVNVYLPKGTRLHPKGFKTCREEALKNFGPIACPKNSAASAVGSVLGEVTFGETRVPEEASLRAFFAPGGGLLFYTNGVEPVSLQVVSAGKFIKLPAGGKYAYELKTVVPVVKGPPGAAYASVKRVRLKAGAAYKHGKHWVFYGTVPRKGECPKGGFPVKAEVFFGGEEGGEEEFGITKKEVTAEFKAPCPKR
jgi:hypothetical protein